ncbi:MAG: hypothetical protein AVDCRST_MAG18-1623 [uncultured Thermomicrobiales bacterium]|uniref:PH domain-containing protein n=1 Tax=uncultured Thermomicrobiales bacterium TaxID=1645740 RepID=A0A6J4V8X7_9BACT|nr:MAG: hypothetical protein AVDCRST_MAG18-1623 [uncultured Thermomicrobiales bacterium]
MRESGTTGGERADTAGEPLVFPGSNGLWVTLAILAALAIPATLWIAGGALSGEGIGAAGRSLLVGGGVTALFALGAWFAWRQRREVVLDNVGVTIRAGDGSARAHIPWAELTGVEERRIPSQPLQPALLLHRADGSALLIDPQQVRDTGVLVREIRRHGAYIGSGDQARRGRGQV